MSPGEAKKILDALFEVVDYVSLLHLAGGGEPFLNPNLADLIDLTFKFADHFNELMVFTNSTVPISDKLLSALVRHKNKIIVHASNYGITSERSELLYSVLNNNGINLRVVKYFGDNQDYGGWVDFGSWEMRGRNPDELLRIYKNCGITKFMNGNWRTRDGKIHWCQRSQRGMELDLLPDCPEDYIDLFGEESPAEKRNKFRKIAAQSFLSACDHCSGNHGTNDVDKRFPAGEQIKER
jgi:hypothetical protein